MSTELASKSLNRLLSGSVILLRCVNICISVCLFLIELDSLTAQLSSTNSYS